MDGLLRLRLALKYTEQSTSDYSCREEYVTQMAPSPTPIPSFFHRNSGHPLLCPPPILFHLPLQPLTFAILKCNVVNFLQEIDLYFMFDQLHT